jgi:hypothetical protein
VRGGACGGGAMTKPQLHTLLFFCLAQLAGLWGWVSYTIVASESKSGWIVLTMLLTVTCAIGALVALAAMWEGMSNDH